MAHRPTPHPLHFFCLFQTACQTKAATIGSLAAETGEDNSHVEAASSAKHAWEVERKEPAQENEL